jgi:DNA polymerase-4
MDWRRVILHVDMDAFFAAIEQLDNPQLRGKPVLVGSDRRRGVVSTASYEARPFGCRSAQPTAVALRMCPHAIVVPVRMQRYQDVSSQLFGILEAFSPLIEPLSIDEAFVDLTGTERALGPGVEVAGRLKQRIRDELHLTGSVGLAPNKFLAKLASDMDKPDGLTVIGPGQIDTVLPPLGIRRLWGVGPKSAERLEAAGIRTFADVRNASEAQLKRLCGGEGEHLRRLAMGLDDRPVVPDHQAKSISQEMTFETDVADQEMLRGVLMGQVEQVAARLRRHGLMARSVALKIRYGQFRTIRRSSTLDTPTNGTSPLWLAAAGLFDEWATRSFSPVRLLGMAATQLSSGGGQMGLFEDPERRRQDRLDGAVDSINKRFGSQSVRRGIGL